MHQGLVQVYTGTGKGKTTAALGCALRAAGNDLKVCIIQFMKPNPSGEFKALEKIDNIEVNHFGTGEFLKKGVDPRAEDFKAAEMGFEFLKEALDGRKYDVVILDEINVILDYNLVNVWEIIEIIENKPPSVEFILTGREAPVEILKIADLVTEMVEIKHYYKNGIEARKGIEY